MGCAGVGALSSLDWPQSFIGNFHQRSKIPVIAIAGTLTGCAEAIAYALQNNLNAEIILQAIAKGAAGSWQMDYNAPKMIKNDYSAGFFIKHFIKDMKIAQSVMAEQNKNLPVLNTVLSMFEELDKRGFAQNGTQSIIDYYKD